MSSLLSPRDREFFTKPNFGHLATVSAQGWPQSTVVWIDLEDEHILVNTTAHRVKTANVRDNPRVGISVTHREDPYKVVSVQGLVVAQTEEGAVDHIFRLAAKYGDEEFEVPAGQVRIILKIEPVRVYRWGYEA